MSLLWPDRLALALYPGHIAWLRARGLRPRVMEKGQETFVGDGASALATAFSGVMEKAGKGAEVSVILSNRLVRYVLVPTPDNARNLAERHRLAMHVFERTYGKAAEQWKIALSHGAAGKGAVASAVDADLIHALQEAASSRRQRLASVQPYLMAAFNRSCRRISERSGIFAVAEPGRLCMAAWNDGGWVGVQQSHMGEGDSDLPGAVARIQVMAGMNAAASGWVLAPECERSVGVTSLKALSVRWPSGLLPENDHAWGGAMLGIN